MSDSLDSAPKRTLIADDQVHVLEALDLLLKREGYHIETADSPQAVLESLGKGRFDLLLMDLNYALDTTSGQEGLDLLERVRRIDSSLPVVVMTAWGNIPLAVEAMRRGARDFVEKPWDNQRLLEVLRRQTDASQLPQPDSVELQDAVATQRDLLPREIAEIAGCEIAIAWQPARAVGGDYLDVIRRSDGDVNLALGDVMGKGVPAALLMANLQASIRALALENLEPSELCRRLNRLVASSIGGGKFITLFLAQLREGSRSLIYTNAGHNPPFLVRPSGEVVRLDVGGLVLGVAPYWQYEQCVVNLEPGDRLVLFSDGIVEAENAAAEAFGEERLEVLLRRHASFGAAALRDEIMAAAAEHGGRRFQDDATVLVVAVA